MTLRRGRVNTVKRSGISQITGDAVGGPSSSSTVEVTIPINTVTYPQMQDVTAANRLLGRGQLYGPGDPEEITIGVGLTMVGNDLQATPFGGAVFTFDDALKAYTTPRP